MPTSPDLRASGDRIEALLDDLRARADARTYDRVEELLRLVCDLYGGGLARILELAAEQAPALVPTLADDELVASLLVVHGLHPESLTQRVERALAKVRPVLAAHGGDVELVDVDSPSGVVGLRLVGSCDGCPSSAITLQMAVERAIFDEAPEAVRVDVVAPPAPVPAVAVSLGAKPEVRTTPAYEQCPSELAPR